MNKYLQKKLTKILILLIILISLLSISIYKIRVKKTNNIVNVCRIITSEYINKIENSLRNGNIESLDNIDMPYSLVSLDGRVIKSTEEGKEELSNINLKEDLDFDNWYEVNNSNNIKYSTLIIIDNNVKAVATFIIPRDLYNSIEGKETNKKYILLSILIFLCILFCIYKVYRIIVDDILNPINEMHNSAKAILKNNFHKKVSYDYDGEIGTFSHDFENMRDSLQHSKEEEMRLKASEKELLACISHDLKTPIAAIMGYCEGILDGIVKKEKDIKRYTEIILKKSKILSKLIDDILEYSKAEINKMTIKKEETYSRDFIYEILEDLSLDVEARNKKFILEGDIPNVLIYVDKKRIQEVFYNIVGNSIKYTKDNGIIKVKVIKNRSYLSVSIQDNGIGIGASDIPYVFHKFYRGEKHRNMNIPGSGLGLSISKYIIEKHGGSIEIKSQSNYGTEVKFTIEI